MRIVATYACNILFQFHAHCVEVVRQIGKKRPRMGPLFVLATDKVRWALPVGFLQVRMQLMAAFF